MSRWTHLAATALLFVAGCPTTTTSSVDDDTDDIIVDTQPDTGWVDETDVDTDGDTDADTDETDDPAPDTDDTAFGGNDTFTCTFGQVPDCNGTCYPQHFVGDGYCDDGDPLPADFDCGVYAFDQGDCGVDTDTDVLPGGTCSYVIRLHLFAWAGEVGWRLEDVTGSALARIAVGTYSASPRVYEYPIDLSDGSYSFYAIDAVPDGWDGGGWWEVVELRTGRQVVRNNGPAAGVREQKYTFSLACSAESGCDLDVRTLAGADGPEMAWDMYTGVTGQLWASRTAGSVSADVTERDTVRVYDNDTYVLRARDTVGDGWDGRVEVRYAGGFLLDAIGLSPGTLPVNRTLTTFRVACADAATGPFDGAGDPIAPVDCSKVVLETQTATNGGEVGWELLRVDGWTPLLTRAPGAFASNTTVRNNLALPSEGLYFLRQLDSGGTGWEGGRLRVRDGVSDAVLLDLPFPRGANTGKYFQLTCSTPPDTDTDVPDTSVRTCAAGAEPDCAGVCWPTALKGDGKCDDGTLYAANFACEAQAWDGGDCAPPAP